MNINMPLLRKVVDWAKVEAERPYHLREWMQSDWTIDSEEIIEEAVYELLGKEQEERGRDFTEKQYAKREAELTAQLTAERAQHCGTAFCCAGYIAHITNPEYVGGFHLPDGTQVSDYAAQQLGFESSQHMIETVKWDLFNGGNSIARVEKIASKMANLAGEEL